MKCPKCDYISFGDFQRCTNCGYDATLATTEQPPADLELHHGDTGEGLPADLTLAPPAPAPPPARSQTARETRQPVSHPSDLPLFDRPVPGVDDTPLLTVPAAPRAPLSVRRSAPDPTRPATPAPAERGDRHRARPIARGDAPVVPSVLVPDTDEDRDERAARPGPRVAAALVDAAILAAIDAAVIYFTLRVTGLDLAQVWRLPAAPLLAFLLLLDFGYLVGFTTASGQTIGKMMFGVQVVADQTTRVPLGQAVIRAVCVGLTVLSAGIGYAPALAGRDRRALHDRLSGTRVVRR